MDLTWAWCLVNAHQIFIPISITTLMANSVLRSPWFLHSSMEESKKPEFLLLACLSNKTHGLPLQQLDSSIFSESRGKRNQWNTSGVQRWDDLWSSVKASCDFGTYLISSVDRISLDWGWGRENIPVRWQGFNWGWKNWETQCGLAWIFFFFLVRRLVEIRPERWYNFQSDNIHRKLYADIGF
jgi:hypothetical protein